MGYVADLAAKEKEKKERTHEELMRIPNGEYRRMYELHIGLHE